MIRRLPLPIAGLVLAGSVAFAQPPQAQAERNLQVLPRDIPHARLMREMQDFTRALGVQCSFCHVPGDFASDANPHKEAARGMMRMTARINGELLPAVEGLHHPEVTCFTCHRGASHPATSPPLPPGAPPREGERG